MLFFSYIESGLGRVSRLSNVCKRLGSVELRTVLSATHDSALGPVDLVTPRRVELCRYATLDPLPPFFIE